MIRSIRFNEQVQAAIIFHRFIYDEFPREGFPVRVERFLQEYSDKKLQRLSVVVETLDTNSGYLNELVQIRKNIINTLEKLLGKALEETTELRNHVAIDMTCMILLKQAIETTDPVS